MPLKLSANAVLPSVAPAGLGKVKGDSQVIRNALWLRERQLPSVRCYLIGLSEVRPLGRYRTLVQWYKHPLKEQPIDFGFASSLGLFPIPTLRALGLAASPLRRSTAAELQFHYFTFIEMLPFYINRSRKIHRKRSHDQPAKRAPKTSIPNFIHFLFA